MQRHPCSNSLSGPPLRDQNATWRCGHLCANGGAQARLRRCSQRKREAAHERPIQSEGLGAQCATRLAGPHRCSAPCLGEPPTGSLIAWNVLHLRDAAFIHTLPHTSWATASNLRAVYLFNAANRWSLVRVRNAGANAAGVVIMQIMY